MHAKCIIVELLLSAREYERRTSSDERGKLLFSAHPRLNLYKVLNASFLPTVEVNVNCARSYWSRKCMPLAHS